MTTTNKLAERSGDELIKIGREVVDRATQYLQTEIKKNPYAVLGAAASLGYVLGQGWMRAALRFGLAFAAQQATRGILPNLNIGDKTSNQMFH